MKMSTHFLITSGLGLLAAVVVSYANYLTDTNMSGTTAISIAGLCFLSLVSIIVWVVLRASGK